MRHDAVCLQGQGVAYYGFGGSIMTTLFHAATIDFDYDLLQHSGALCETMCTRGTSLGRARQQGPGWGTA
jgi:phosphatidylserine decarboxylase